MSHSDHAIVGTTQGQYEHTVKCACGETFTASTAEKAMRDHAYHFGLASARSALRGGAA